MYKRGISVKEIARKLGIGVGEVSLVVGLYEKEKQMQ
jgi:transposase